MLIDNRDGTFSRMDEPYFRSELVAPGTWRILSDGDSSYLVEGDNEALVIDSGYGCGSIRDYCQSLTEKPVRNIANTHDHFDHTANNYLFDCAMMSAQTKELASIPFPSFEGIDFPRDYPVKILEEGDAIDLGGRTLEVFFIPDHAVGSLAFLDRRERILFIGDEIEKGGKGVRGTVERWAGYMEKLAAHRDEFDILCGGGLENIDGSVIEGYLEICRDIMNGMEGEKAKPFVPPFTDQGTDGQGRTVYVRYWAHWEDTPKGILNADMSTKRFVKRGLCNLSYDINRIFE